MELIWSLGRHTPRAVLEANFRPHSAYERDKLAGLQATVVEVYCDCGPAETTRRFRERATASAHHAAHPLKGLPPELLAEYDRPLGMGPVIEVDTRTSVDVDRVVADVRRLLF